MKLLKKVMTAPQKLLTGVINWLGQFLDKPTLESFTWCAAEYDILVYDVGPDGKPDLNRFRPDLSALGHNMVVDGGRKQVLKHVLNITSPAAPVNFPYLAVGSSSAAAVETQTALTAELTANATRKTLLNTSDVTLSDTDIVFEVSGLFRWKVVAQATFADTDANNGSTFAEYGIFSVNTFSPSGVMYNRFVHPSPFTKSASLAVVVRMTLRT